MLTWRAVILFGIAGLATYGFVELAELVVEGRADATDRAVALAIHRIDSPVLDQIFITITQLGSNVMINVAVLATTIWLWRGGHRRTAVILIVNAVVAQILMVALKIWIARPRPTLFDEITRPETFSFPSGHAMTAMAIYGGIAAALITHYRHHRVAITAAAALLIAAIGFSRVYLGVHWPLDVLAGFAAGTPFVVATVYLLHTRAKGASGPAEMNLYSRA